MRQFYYKMRQFLQFATILLQNAKLLQIVTVKPATTCFVCPVSSFRFSRLKMGSQIYFYQFPILVISRKCDIKIKESAYV